MTRHDILDKAIKCACEDREKKHGNPEDSFQLIADFWGAYLEEKIYPVDVAIMMALLKIARIRLGHFEEDSYVDLAGYAACAGELASNDENVQVYNVVQEV